MHPTVEPEPTTITAAADPVGGRSGAFADRAEAGRELARLLVGLRHERPVVIGLPRGGVPVAAEVARALDADLDVIVVRKLGVPDQPELAMGAIGEGGVLVLDADVIRIAGIDDATVAAVENDERDELERRVRRFRRGRPALSLAGRTAIVTDDGIATGATARAALQVARALGARRIVLAVPVAPPDSLDRLRTEADAVVSVLRPAAMWAVGAYYRDFRPVEADEVVRIVDTLRRRPGRSAPDRP